MVLFSKQTHGFIDIVIGVHYIWSGVWTHHLVECGHHARNGDAHVLEFAFIFRECRVPKSEEGNEGVWSEY